MTRLRPSIRKLQKRVRDPKRGGLYPIHKAAEERVLARLAAALDRIRVASEFDEFGGATVAQLAHAHRYIVEGRDEPERSVAWGWVVNADVADQLVRTLADLYHDALVDELLEQQPRLAETAEASA